MSYDLQSESTSTHHRLKNHLIAAYTAGNDEVLWIPLERALLWISGWDWEWVKNGHCSFILSDTPGIPCSHLCHFLFKYALLTEPLINHDNNVFLLFSPHLTVPWQITFCESQQVRLKFRPPGFPTETRVTFSFLPPLLLLTLLLLQVHSWIQSDFFCTKLNERR